MGINKPPKVLVAAPIYDKMNYCVNNFLERLKNLEYDNYDILIVDNSKEDGFFQELKKIDGIILIKDDTNEERNLLRLVSSRNKIIDYALKNNYDYILMMDSDVIPPKNILSELLNENKDIISGLYYNYFMVNSKRELKPVCWTELSEELFKEINEKLKLPDTVKSRLDLRRFLTEEEADSGNIIKVRIPSPGCMLIKRDVFEKVRYGLLDVPDGMSTTDDVFFCTKASELGFEIYCDTKLKCEHLFFEKLYKDDKGALRNPFYD